MDQLMSGLPGVKRGIPDLAAITVMQEFHRADSRLAEYWLRLKNHFARAGLSFRSAAANARMSSIKNR
jgi:hypothetical protein